MAAILVADDDPLLLKLVEHKLKSRGFAVHCASDGEAALEMARDRRPDLIVLDAMMPGIEGFEVLRRLAADPGTSGIPVIMLTARRLEADIVSALSLGARDYLVKPFMPEELVMRIRNLLGAEAIAR
jgi:DNA-binding response OmpR family regulator